MFSMLYTLAAQLLAVGLVQFPDDSASHETLELARDAAIEALWKVEDRSSEWGGFIIRDEAGYYRVSTVATSHDPTRLALRLPGAVKGRLAATFHSHPWVVGVERGHKPSPEDLQTAKRYGVPMYILNMANGKVIEIDGQKIKTGKK